jgi:hypothetical protein
MPVITVCRKLCGNYNFRGHEMVKALSRVHRGMSSTIGNTNCELLEYRTNSRHEDISRSGLVHLAS